MWPIAPDQFTLHVFTFLSSRERIVQEVSSRARASRFFRVHGRSGETRRTKARISEAADRGRRKKKEKSPWDRMRDLRRLFSSIGPSTNASTRGAPSYSNFFIR